MRFLSVSPGRRLSFRQGRSVRSFSGVSVMRRDVAEHILCFPKRALISSMVLESPSSLSILRRSSKRSNCTAVHVSKRVRWIWVLLYSCSGRKACSKRFFRMGSASCVEFVARLSRALVLYCS